ncbi:MAG TPA: ion channel [Terriglobia bacterium]|nr:ion channel [Terriglobia bacterium]
MNKPSFDPGFTQKYGTGLSRIINPSGEFNVRRRGTTWRDFHAYLFMINTSWTVFFLLILGGYIVANMLFALIYMKLGVQHLQGADTSTTLSRFLSAFFFSAQTFTTVGYGRISPDSVLTNLVASFQALLGLMALAIGTGLLFGRFSRPAARLAFSKQMLVAPYQSATSLQFRVANRRSNNLMEVEARVMLSTVESSEEGLVRKYMYLTLERQGVQFLPLTWTIVHPIDESSPLWGKKPEDLMRRQAEFLITIKAFDDTFFQTVHVRHSYRFEEVVWGARFAPAFEPDAQGEMVLDLGKLSAIAPVENPRETLSQALSP